MISEQNTAGRASAARAARVNVLPLAVEYQNAAVGVELSELYPVAAEKLLERVVPDGTEGRAVTIMS